jgi:hypothetical protein
MELELLGSQQVERLGGVKRRAVPRILAQPAIDLPPFRRAVPSRRCFTFVRALVALARALQQHDGFPSAYTLPRVCAFCSTTFFSSLCCDIPR